MKNNDYLFAVATIRANEVNLLKEADMEQLINAPDYKKAIAVLCDKGYSEPEGSDYSAMLDAEITKTWELINKSAPEAEALKTFVVKNDFQNLKAILKSEVSGHNASEYFVSPCVADPDDMLEKIKERKFDDLPQFLSQTAKEAFDTITKTSNGQLCDAVIDTAALENIVAFAKESNDDTLIEYAEDFCIAANIKTAYRSLKTGKNRAFMELSVAKSEKIDRENLIKSALAGETEFFDFLVNSGFSGYGEALKKGTSAFEKFCDDKMLDTMKKAKMTAFGISPLAAYFVAKETEIKCLRIILSAKVSGFSNDVIRERMRELYV